MPISLRTHRAKLFEYHDGGTEGSVDSTYLVIASSAADERWWCSKLDTSGHEVTTGMQPDHRVNAVFVFSKHAPLESPDGFNVGIDCDGASYLIRSIMPRDYGHDEVQVEAERIAEMELTAS